MSENRLFIEEMARNVRLSVKLRCLLSDIALWLYFAAVILVMLGISKGIAMVVLWVIE